MPQDWRISIVTPIIKNRRGGWGPRAVSQISIPGKMIESQIKDKILKYTLTSFAVGN